MLGNASNELKQSAEFLASLVKAGALVVPELTKQARQSWIGLPPQRYAQVLLDRVFMPSGDTAQGHEKRTVEKPQKLLIPYTSMSACVLEKDHYPDVYYRTRTGIYVAPDFVLDIVRVAQSTRAGTKFKQRKQYKLARDGITGTALFERKPRSVFKASEFCAWLAHKINQQPKGRDGELYTNASVNLFLVCGFNDSVFIVRVIWSGGLGKCCVTMWSLDSKLLAGDTFVSR